MKYLISIYFDEATNRQIYKHMEAVAKASGNDYMLANKVPPHITLSSFETDDITPVWNALRRQIYDVAGGEIKWVGSGAFMTSVLYLTPVLNEYLLGVMQEIYDCILTVPDIKISKYYKPYQWLPHTTIGKKMTEEELYKGFAAVQGSFQIITGKVVRLGLAKASPYEEIEIL